jgi:hypothetical protein
MPLALSDVGRRRAPGFRTIPRLVSYSRPFAVVFSLSYLRSSAVEFFCSKGSTVAVGKIGSARRGIVAVHVRCDRDEQSG